jgi:hypothetical protein
MSIQGEKDKIHVPRASYEPSLPAFRRKAANANILRLGVSVLLKYNVAAARFCHG